MTKFQYKSNQDALLFLVAVLHSAWLLIIMCAIPLSALSFNGHSERVCTLSVTSLGRSNNKKSALLLQAETTTTTTTTKDVIDFITGIEKLAPTYDTFLLDMWGVMHNGSAPYPGVLACVEELSRAGKRLVILSNSSKRSHHVIHMLKKLGFNPDNFHAIFTSGEICHGMLSGDTTLPCETWPILKHLIATGQTNAIVLGSGEDDKDYVRSAGWDLANDVSEANLIIARGTFTIVSAKSVISKETDENRYQETLHELLTKAAKQSIPMFICNPDKVRPDESLSPMPGAIGDAYVDALQRHNTNLSLPNAQWLVKRIGKPYQEMYHCAIASIGGCSELARLGSLMVGDALETDVTGGAILGCSTVWVVRDGIHGAHVAELEEQLEEEGEEDSASLFERAVKHTLQKFNAPEGLASSKMGQEDDKKIVVPTFVLPHFRWG